MLQDIMRLNVTNKRDRVGVFMTRFLFQSEIHAR